MATRVTDHLTGCVTGFCASEHHIDWCDLDWLPWPTVRCLGAELWQLLERASSRDLQRRPEWPRRDGVDAYALARYLLRQCFGECDDAGLGRCVVEEICRGIVCLLRRRGDDAGPGSEVGHRRLRDPEQRVEIGL